VEKERFVCCCGHSNTHCPRQTRLQTALNGSVCGRRSEHQTRAVIVLHVVSDATQPVARAAFCHSTAPVCRATGHRVTSLLLLFVFSILISWTMGKSPSVRCPAMLCMAVALSMARAELDEIIDGLADDVHDWSRDPRALDFTSADANGDGAVDRSEYLAFFRAPMERLRLKDHERLKSALEASDRMRGNIFQRLDRDSDARLSRDEWDRVFISPAHGGRPGGAGDLLPETRARTSSRASDPRSRPSLGPTGCQRGCLRSKACQDALT